MRRAATAALLLAAVDSFPSDLLKDDCAKGVLLVDGGLLDALSDGDANRAAMPATGRPELSVAVQAGDAVLPLGGRIVALRPAAAEEDGAFDVSLSIETADAAADAQPPPHERLARLEASVGG